MAKRKNSPLKWAWTTRSKGQRASVEFVVIGDDKELWKSGLMRAGDAPKACSVDLTGVKVLELLVNDGGNGTDFDHADWADAKIEAAKPPKIRHQQRDACRALHSHASGSGHAAHQRRECFWRASRLALSVHRARDRRPTDELLGDTVCPPD